MNIRIILLIYCVAFSIMASAQASGGQIRRSSPKPKTEVQRSKKPHKSRQTQQVEPSSTSGVILSSTLVEDSQESYSLSTSKGCYEQAKKTRMEGNGRLAIDLYLRANRIGESPYKLWALHQIGYIYYTGLGGVKSNYFEAFRYFKMASDLGFLPSTYYLGVCYEYGRGVGKDLSMAKYYYSKSRYQQAPENNF